MAGQVRVFLNAKSGNGGVDVSRLKALFAQHGCDCEITELSPQLDLKALANGDPEAVCYVASGGDGTVNCVANVVCGTRRAMAVLPAGTLNHFARDLGLPESLDEAVALAAGETTRRVDAAEVNGKIFVNNSGLGAYPLMVLDRERMKARGWNKWISLAAASSRAFLRLWRVRVEVEVDGVTRVCRTPFVFIGNNQYCLDGLRLGSRERLDGGELAVYFARDVSRLGVLKMAAAALLGRVKQVQEYEEVTGREVTLRLPRPRPRVSLDGEIHRLPAPLRYRILPGALTVRCGKESSLPPEGERP